MKKPFEEIFADVESLLRNYATEFRKSLQPYRYQLRKESDPDFSYDPEDPAVRESLIEHVGTLPILAVFFHGHVPEPVNLGRVLEMLAVHDIGETTLGDEIVFTKKDEKEAAETIEALKLLDPRHHSAYLEFQALQTNEAKFARSIDKIGPDLYDYIAPAEITTVRLKHFANIDADAIVETIQEHKSPSMQWSVFFKEFHAELIQRLRVKFRETNK